MNEIHTSQDTRLASPNIICGAPYCTCSLIVGSRGTKAYKIQSLPQKLCYIILHVDDASMLHLCSAFKLTKYSNIHYFT